MLKNLFYLNKKLQNNYKIINSNIKVITFYDFISFLFRLNHTVMASNFNKSNDKEIQIALDNCLDLQNNGSIKKDLISNFIHEHSLHRSFTDLLRRIHTLSIFSSSSYTSLKQNLNQDPILNLFLLIDSINSQIKNENPTVLNEAFTVTSNLQTLTMFTGLRNIFLNKDTEWLIYILNNQALYKDFFNEKTIEDILMTISLEKYIGISKDLEDLIEPCLNIINKNIDNPLNRKEISALKKLIMTSSKFIDERSQACCQAQFVSNICKVIKNYNKIKFHLSEIKEHVKILEPLTDSVLDSSITLDIVSDAVCNISLKIDREKSDFNVSEIYIDNYNFSYFQVKYSNNIKALCFFFNLSAVKKLKIHDTNIERPQNSVALNLVWADMFKLLKLLPNLESLSLESCTLDPRNAFSIPLDHIFSENKKLHSLFLKDIERSTPQLVTAFAEFLSNQDTVKDLDIFNPNFDLKLLLFDDTCNFKNILKKLNGKLQGLSLTNKYYAGNFLKDLVDCLCTKALSETEISEDLNNEFASIDSEKEKSNISKAGLKRLNLCEYRFRKIEEVFYILDNIKTLEELVIEDNFLKLTADEKILLSNKIQSYASGRNFKIVGEGFFSAETVPIFFESRYKNQFLDLSHNCLYLDKGDIFKAVNKAFKSIKTIKNVSLANFSSDFLVLAEIMSHLKYTEVESLDLSDNKYNFVFVSPINLSTICKSLKSLSSLKSLKLSHSFNNQIFCNSPSFYYSINLVLESIPNIDSFDLLDLRECYLSVDEKYNSEHYLNLFNRFKNIKNVYIDLAFFDFYNVEVANIIDAMRKNPEFKNIHLKVTKCIEYGSQYLPYLSWKLN